MAKLWQKRNHLSTENRLFVTCNATRRINKITHIEKRKLYVKHRNVTTNTMPLWSPHIHIFFTHGCSIALKGLMPESNANRAKQLLCKEV